jgi:hypothetical protein
LQGIEGGKEGLADKTRRTWKDSQISWIGNEQIRESLKLS